MTFYSSGEPNWAERWDQLYDALAAGPRRVIISSLGDEPEERRLPLPEAAMSPNQTIDAETLAVELHHHHLPKLANAGYVCWESDPFCVQRGPRFQEVWFVVETLFESVDEMPDSLINNCKNLREITDNGED